MKLRLEKFKDRSRQQIRNVSPMVHSFGPSSIMATTTNWKHEKSSLPADPPNPILRHIMCNHHFLCLFHSFPVHNNNNLMIVQPLLSTLGVMSCNFAFVSLIAGGSFALRKQEVITNAAVGSRNERFQSEVCRSFDIFAKLEHAAGPRENGNYCRNTDEVFCYNPCFIFEAIVLPCVKKTS